MRPRSRAVLCLSMLLSALGCETQRVTVPVIPPLLPIPKPAVFWREPFDTLDPTRWREVTVRRRTQYEAITLDGRRCLRAQSHDGASILMSAVRFDPHAYARLSWAWRVDRLVDGEALDRKDGSDAAARVYVYFETPGLPWQKHSLDYVWSATLPVGTVLDSAYAQTSKIIVVESGADSPGQWRTETRNLVDDYTRCFGEAPPDVVAIGVMSDTDTIGGDALAYFDELRVNRSTP